MLTVTEQCKFEFARHFGAPTLPAGRQLTDTSSSRRVRATGSSTQARNKDGGDGGGNGVICWSSGTEPE